MPPLAARALGALHRFNATHPWDHNAHHHRWITRRLPRRPASALDVGCGSGDLARLLARRATTVHALDADPAVLALARGLTPPAAPVTYALGDAVTDLPPGPHDVITCVAVLHHLPFAEALTAFRERLAPGGTLLVVGLYRRHTRRDALTDAVAIPANAAMGWLRNRGRRAPLPVAMTAPTRPAGMTLEEITREARRLLPGARLRRRLFWRYTLEWRRP
ncbi:class I SAM-dependent methyltransferase [Streptomyces avicenniae]|uniref:class I SAM-dependent methyltransferase n=1 Tax=Streptomyces avicenniae TaxID=500153 RepID=UPI000699C845|nr:class I SAM-dependent methyltransferase [Streptomyces avicenniae]